MKPPLILNLLVIQTQAGSTISNEGDNKKMASTPNNTAPVDIQQEIITEVSRKHAAKEDIDIFEMARSLELDNGMKQLRDHLVSLSICTKAEYARAVKISKTVKVLGFYPQTAVEFVDAYIKLNKIEVNYQRAMKRVVLPIVEGVIATEEDRKDRTFDAIARIIENDEINTATLARDLRLLVHELDLRFSKQEIDDAVSSWFDAALNERVKEVFYSVGSDGKGLNSADKLKAWEIVAEQFDNTAHGSDFTVLVLKKFIWQVKRKMLGLPITNHLMPVITGPQGVGKSTFVREYLLKPVDELTGNADFKMLEEDRNTEQWRNYVLFLDEMGYAMKANIDNVKNKITAANVTGRPMGTNSNVQYRQNATFIGCSNKELDQLIRDETGNRRFVSLRYSSKPNWAAMTELDPYALWLSVDERGDDPTATIMDKLRESQELIREKSAVEQWVDQLQVPMIKHGKKQASAELYRDYKMWAETYSSRSIMDQLPWAKEFNRLMKAGQISGWESKRSGGHSYYVYK
ncbi:VapE domain-containing protein [Agrobacterium vaccinii]|uniref:VapE domain-containing protein n=1 Tax=Agrobacterium vaccinii TaxID=2735528 RepID=UPI001E467703|nr:VapE domain-containing protein [Agrobacterium vaccinii]